MNQNTRPYLIDSDLDKQLAENGFVVVPMLSSKEVDGLRNTFDEAHQNHTVPFYATGHHESSEFRKKMSNAISSVLDPVASNLFNDCDLLGASFISKAANSESSLQPHQDWNIVDEAEFRSFNIWIPLVDLDETNGAIEVLPKSHNWIRGYRHSSINCAYRKVHSLVWDNMKPLYLRAGEALIYDHALLHASKANTSSQNRIAIACGIMPTEAKMHFYWNNNGMIEQYESNTDFFMTENIFNGPAKLKKMAQFGYDFPVVEEADFYRFLGIKPPQVEPISVKTQESSDSRPRFWKVYTPMNILREINYRLTSKK